MESQKPCKYRLRDSERLYNRKGENCEFTKQIDKIIL